MFYSAWSWEGHRWPPKCVSSALLTNREGQEKRNRSATWKMLFRHVRCRFGLPYWLAKAICSGTVGRRTKDKTKTKWNNNNKLRAAGRPFPDKIRERHQYLIVRVDCVPGIPLYDFTSNFHHQSCGARAVVEAEILCALAFLSVQAGSSLPTTSARDWKRTYSARVVWEVFVFWAVTSENDLRFHWLFLKV